MCPNVSLRVAALAGTTVRDLDPTLLLNVFGKTLWSGQGYYCPYLLGMGHQVHVFGTLFKNISIKI